jgi:AcrR family transcriptional regulator
MSMPRQPAETRRKLLECAARAFLAHGYHATGLESLVQATGLTKGALFHHFDGKESLAIAVLDEVVAPTIEAAWITPLAAGEHPIDTLKSILIELQTNHAAGTARPRPEALSPLAKWLTATGDEAPRLRLRIEQLHGLWHHSIAEALRRGRDHGSVHRSVVPRDEAAFFLAWLHGAALLLTTDAATGGGLFQSAAAYLETLRPAGT